MRRVALHTRRTKIVCTIGPASSSATMLRRLALAGMDVARLNLSHGSQAEHTAVAENVRAVAEKLGVPLALMVDVPGPKHRVGNLPGGRMLLRKGAMITLAAMASGGDSNTVPIGRTGLAGTVKIGDAILLDDGALRLRVVAVRGESVDCTVVVGGSLTDGRGVVVPGLRLTGPYLTPEIQQAILFALSLRPDYLALSFVSTAADVVETRAFVQNAGAGVPLLAKIERGQAVEDFEAILAASDAIMVARGDLGVDIPLERVPFVQKEIIGKCRPTGKPVVTATEMLASMVEAARPTRAETTDVANAVLDGTDAVMLSAETSVGKYPVQAVQMMDRIARRAERVLPARGWGSDEAWAGRRTTEDAISEAACAIAAELRAKAIVAFTQSGSTAARISRFRPHMPILAITPNQALPAQLVLHWGVHPIPVAQISSLDALFALGSSLPLLVGVARPGDLVVLTGGVPLGEIGSTSLLQVQRVRADD